ncbi:MAG: VWA domain-containing protein [Verrucomicrobiales bacterium]|nr:VWA domain-containing protein [Verrucomicrobiales bacterium]
MVLLISDGVESCDGDPLKVIAELDRKGIKFQTHVIGFDLNAEEEAALRKIATIGGGNYYNAKNYGELLNSLDQFARDASVAAPPKPPAYLNPVVGGKTYEEAVEIGPGNYTIRDSLKKGEFAWFKVPSKKAQRVAVRATVQGARLSRDSSGKLVESKVVNGGATVQFVRNDRPDRAFSSILLSSSSLVGDWKRTHVLDLTGQGSVFRVGSEHSEASPNALIEVIVQEAGDLYEGYEAPDDRRSTELFDAPLNDTFYGHIGAQDRKDAYRIQLGENPPEKLKVSIEFSNVDEPVKHKLEFYNTETGARLHRVSGAEKSSTVRFETQGARTITLLIQDDLANSILRTYMNSYKLRIEPEK